MKLSDKIALLVFDESLSPDTEVTTIKNLGMEAKQLESDSQMLDDLIEMLDCNGMWWIEQFDEYWSFIQNKNLNEFSKTQGRGSTPREAIAAAVKQWRESK